MDCPERLARDLDAAFPTFVRHHQDLVYGVALRLSDGRAADAEDLAQESLVRAYRALRSYDAERIRGLHVRGWLATITLNLGRNRARRAASRVGNAPIEAAAEAPADVRYEPQARALERESAGEWRSRLDALPHAYRDAVALRHVHGLSYPELALALGRPVGTVKSDVHRGVALLRSALEAEQRT